MRIPLTWHYDMYMISGCCINDFLDVEPEARALYESLGEEVVLYRGTSQSESESTDSMGASWTPNRDVAEFFVFRDRQEGRAVISITAKKRDIAAISVGRNEDEVIVLNAGDYPVTTVTTTPTDCFNYYMKLKEENCRKALA